MNSERKTDQRADSSITSQIGATDVSEQHALDAWEGEGGTPSGALSRRDPARTALTDNAGWRASHNVGWQANDPHATRQRWR